MLPKAKLAKKGSRVTKFKGIIPWKEWRISAVRVWLESLSPLNCGALQIMAVYLAARPIITPELASLQIRLCFAAEEGFCWFHD